MNNRKLQIGIDRIISVNWLDKMSQLILAGNDKDTICEIFDELLKDKLSGGKPGVRGSREKTITILLKTWLTVPSDLKALRDYGLKLLRILSQKDRIIVHWGMIQASYPFWSAVAAHTGRILNLQKTVASVHIQRRIREDYGERETVSRATQRVLRSFLDWGVLKETGDKGIYWQGNQYQVEDPSLITWLVEASLHTRLNGSAAIKDLLVSPSIFPFRLAHISAEHVASLSPRLNILKHGLDDDLLMLSKEAEAE